MSKFVPRAFEISLTKPVVNSLHELMTITGKSYAQICKDGIDRARQNLSRENLFVLPEEWLEQVKVEPSRSILRLPTETLEELDTLASCTNNASWGEVASFIVECETYYSLAQLEEPLE